MLEALGLGLWAGPASAVRDGPAVAPPAETTRPVPPILDHATADVCTACPRRTTPIAARGAAEPAWLVVGGVPEPDDIAEGQAFSGAPGHLLRRMLSAVGLPPRGEVDVADVRMTFAVRCAPVEGRVPRGDQLAACGAGLRAEIERLQPRVVLALGRTAAQGVLGVDDASARRRGVVHRVGGVPVVVTHELPFLLRQPEAKAEAWDDLCLAREAAQTTAPPSAQ